MACKTRDSERLSSDFCVVHACAKMTFFHRRLIHIAKSRLPQHDAGPFALQQGAGAFAGLNALEMMLLLRQLANNWAVAVETGSFPEVQVAAVTV